LVSPNPAEKPPIEAIPLEVQEFIFFLKNFGTFQRRLFEQISQN
jgi:hypothetical protein